MAKETLNLEVKSNIKSVTKDTDKLTTSLGKSVDETKDLDKGLEDAGKSGKKGFKAIGTGVKALGMALKAAGIGLIIALFVSLQEALSRNQKVMNTVNTVMTTVSTTFNQVVDVLVDVFGWVTAAQDRFDGLTKVITSLMTIALTPLKLSFYAIKLAVQGAMLAWEDSFLGGGDEEKIAALRAEIKTTSADIKQIGLDAIAAGKEIGENIGDAISEIGSIGEMVIDQVSKISIKSNYEMAKATTAAANSSKLAEAQIQGLIEKYDRQAELQRQIRDDERKTFDERKTANDEIAKILEKQEKEMMDLANTMVAAAALEVAANKTNVDLQFAYQATLNDRAGVEAQIAGFRSEQIVNEAALEKELAETKKQIAAELLEGQERELLELKQAYELKLDMARKAGVYTLEITEKYEKEEQAIKDEYAKIARDEEQKTADFKNELAMKSFQLVGSHLDASMSELESSYAKEKALAEANGQDTTAIDEKYEAKRKEIANQQKAFKVAEALITTYQMASLAYKDGLEAGGPAGIVLGPIAAAIAAAAGLANVRQILAQDVGGGGGGNTPSPSASPPSPQMMSGAFQLEGGQAPEPLQAYVVSDDITNNQNALAIIRRRATI